MVIIKNRYKIIILLFYILILNSCQKDSYDEFDVEVVNPFSMVMLTSQQIDNNTKLLEEINLFKSEKINRFRRGNDSHNFSINTDVTRYIVK